MRLLNTFLILMLLGLQYRLWVGEGSIAHNVELGKKVEQQQQVNQTLEERNALLAAEVVNLQQGTDSIEEYARSKLGMIKPNETFYLVVEKM